MTRSNLSFQWPDGTTVLDGHSLTARPGPHRPGRATGTGKSTLLCLFAGRLRTTRGVCGRRRQPLDIAPHPGNCISHTIEADAGCGVGLSCLSDG
ncbi:hypothetical protein GCM10027168_11540 [Streptomyces capparidis]